jgi:hypothetical protein
MNVGYFTESADWLQDKMFDPAADINFFSRYRALKEHCAAAGIVLHTYDVFASIRDIDIWLVQEPTRATVEFLNKNHVESSRVIFFLHEPPVVNPWGWRYIERQIGRASCRERVSVPV